MSRPSQRPRGAATARKKQVVALTVLVAIMSVVWLKNLDLSAPTSASAHSSPETSLDASEPGTPDRTRAARDEIRIAWPATRSRDLFTVDRSAYVRRPVAVEEPVVIDEPAVPDGPSDEELVALALEALSLQGTIEGDVPQAFINGEVYRVGDNVDGFIVQRIDTRSVVLRYKSIEVTLGM